MKKNLKKRIYTSATLGFLIFLISISEYFLLYTLIVLSVVSFLEFLNITNKIFINKFYILISNIFYLLYVFLFCFFFLFFTQIPQLKIIIFSLLLGCAASDIGGFIFGKVFKGPKLTKISPNKTISGSIGSFLLAGIIFPSSIYYFTNNLSLNIIIIGFMTSLICQFGDLFFSFLKRNAKIKDTGNFFPGHGGVLDRIDGLLLGIPAGFFSLIIFY
jgi:phosphatidate cytidylyltransferase|tara:strand:+ start:130 stop:777 length:648 start_codon:yes stop_codon:yes gene_type:complete